MQFPDRAYLQVIERKKISWGIVGKSAPTLAEIMARQSQNCMAFSAKPNLTMLADTNRQQAMVPLRHHISQQAAEVITLLLICIEHYNLFFHRLAGSPLDLIFNSGIVWGHVGINIT